MVIILGLLGLVFGSFVGVVSYRLPKGLGFVKGRSRCPHCQREIRWFDNIPLVSFILLGGKCRSCGQKISLREPLIELASALGFMGIFAAVQSCNIFSREVICLWTGWLGYLALPFFLILFLIILTIFVCDWEGKIIPDELTFLAVFLTFLALILGSSKIFYLHLVSGFLAAAVLLGLHLLTKGKGMGLGDVKFALFPGLFLGWPGVLVWLFLAFLTGATVGVILILAGKAHFRKPIAFGPFLVISFAIVSLWANFLLKLFIK